ncbi:hypothetical protein CTP10_R68040 (plasmid) [Cupriavidus sp. P-10]|uniref:hypothetical protein n=1 Tax=Cupriavidus sp. P-10 TaxID=2027911 RepID=UPI0011C0FB89|nr:hypothetical protein [Cupriavidus sp. P-10]BDB29390.1 hypothetical protein CTP10_R68040 [Cupriavidus sp. P-10]
MPTPKALMDSPPDTRSLYPATALYARVDTVELTAAVAYGNWSPDAELAAQLECPILALNPLAYHFFVMPPEVTVDGHSLVRAVPK